MNPITKINDMAAKLLPGMKTKILTAVGALGGLAALLQEFVTGIPLTQLIGETKALWINVGLFATAFWTRILSDRE